MTYLNLFAPSGHAICKNLRCKEMYYTCASHLKKNVRVESDEDDRHVYWCVKTANALGVDRKLTTLDSCSPDRDCYEP
jgi:hypothetical protein